jgi:hypothetical protein
VECVWATKKWRLCINNRPVNKRGFKWKVKFEGIEIVKELMKSGVERRSIEVSPTPQVSSHS